MLTFFLLACQPGSKPDQDSRPTAVDSGGGDSAVDDSGEDSGADVILAEDWCETVTAGAPGDEDPILALSRLHASVRLFRPSADWVAADQALVDALEGEALDPDAALETYGPAVGACVLTASSATLGEATVEMSGEIAVITPGTGAVEIPAGARGVALDLRGLPTGPETEAALTVALEAVLPGAVVLGKEQLRKFTGFPGIGGISSGIYSAALPSQNWTVTGAASAALPMAVLTERAMAPEAARVAAALRMEQLAWLVGHPVWSAAAEASWSPLGERGVAYRSRTMRQGGDPWPDRIPADTLTEDPRAALDGLAGWGDPPPVEADEPTREQMARWDPDLTPLSTLSRGAARATLMVAHGVVERFYPYFDVVGREHDAALLAGLDEVDALAEGDREGVLRALGRFMHSLQDGHGFFGDWYGTEYLDSYLALQVQQVDGQAVVRSSGDPAVLAGDTVVEIDGIDAASWYEDNMAWRSAATQGYLFEVAGRGWSDQVVSTDLVVRGVDGEERSVTLDGMSAAEVSALVPWGGTLRPSGWLDELGDGTVYLLNLGQTVTTNDADWEGALAEAAGASGLVVDMRDYPVINHYSVAEALRAGDFTSPLFRTRTWNGPDVEGLEESSYRMSGEPLFSGPIVLLVSNKTISAAENFSMMLWDAENVTVMGQQSAGTNGNLTAGYLPGGYYLYFTSMEVLNPDGSQHHGLGIPLDAEVLPTAEDFAAGRDPELEAAVSFLLGG